MQSVKDGIQIQVYDINNASVNDFRKFISVKVKNNLRKFQAQFREKLRTLRLWQNDDSLIEKTCSKHSTSVERSLRDKNFWNSQFKRNQFLETPTFLFLINTVLRNTQFPVPYQNSTQFLK